MSPVTNKCSSRCLRTTADRRVFVSDFASLRKLRPAAVSVQSPQRLGCRHAWLRHPNSTFDRAADHSSPLILGKMLTCGNGLRDFVDATGDDSHWMMRRVPARFA
jgi:hypothetical protein